MPTREEIVATVMFEDGVPPPDPNATFAYAQSLAPNLLYDFVPPFPDDMPNLGIDGAAGDMNANDTITEGELQNTLLGLRNSKRMGGFDANRYVIAPYIAEYPAENGHTFVFAVRTLSGAGRWDFMNSNGVETFWVGGRSDGATTGFLAASAVFDIPCEYDVEYVVAYEAVGNQLTLLLDGKRVKTVSRTTPTLNADIQLMIRTTGGGSFYDIGFAFYKNGLLSDAQHQLLARKIRFGR